MPTVRISENTTRDFTGVDDAGSNVSTPTTPAGSATSFVCSGFGDEIGFLRFQGLSNIDSGATVTAVTIGLTKNNVTAAGSVAFKPLLRAWVEAELTHNVYSTGNSWQTAGGSGALDSEAASATLTCDTAAATVTFSDAALLADVQDFISGAQANEGWRLTHTSDYAGFVSSEGADGSRPYIDVTYTASGATSPPPRPQGTRIAPLMFY